MRASTKLIGWPLLAGLVVACDEPRPFVGFDARPCVPDPAKHDEDGDGFPDSCDVCPLVVDPRQLDTTEGQFQAFPDGVGDACDLVPSASGDDLVALHTFADPTEMKWEGSGWSVADGRATATGDADWQARDTEEGDGLAVHVRVVTWGPTGELRVGADGDATTRGVFCALVRDRDGDGRDELDVGQVTGASATRSLPPLAGDFTLMVWRYINREREGQVHCRVSDGETEYRVMVPTIADSTEGSYALAIRGGSTAVAAVAVYTQPVNPCIDPMRCPRP